MTETRKPHVRTLIGNAGDLMLQDIGGDVKSRKNISVPTVNFVVRSKRRRSIMLSRSKNFQVPSSRRFVLLLKNSLRANTLSNNIDGRGMEHGAKQRKTSDTVAELNKIVEEEGPDGEKLKQELSGCQHFLLDTEMEMGNIRYLTSICPQIFHEKLEEV